MKIVHVELRIKQGRAAEFAAGVEKMVRAIEQVDGTLAFVVSQSEADPHDFRFFEIYRDEAAFQEHLRVSTTELPGREALDALVEGPFRPTFGRHVAGGARLGVARGG
jgi:quinol monooxygenase YgiN